MGSTPTPQALQLVKTLMNLPENAVCADCQKKATKWASSTLGVFICIDCSGIHRSLGTHITFVRSCTLDSWTPEQAKLMKRVGNRVANEYWEAKLPPHFSRPLSTDRFNMENFIRQKYAERRWAAEGVPPHLRKVQVHSTTRPPVSLSQPSMSPSLSSSQIQAPEPSFNIENIIGQYSSSEQSQAPSPKPAIKPPTAAKKVVTDKPQFEKKVLHKPRGAARFMKKPSGDDVLGQMSSQSSSFRPVSAPVAHSKPLSNQSSLFDGLDFSNALNK